MSPQEFYQTFREQQQALLRVTSRTRNWITVLKLLCFAALVFCLYRLRHLRCNCVDLVRRRHGGSLYPANGMG